MWHDIAKFGKKLVERGLIESHFGNMSVRAGSQMLITKSGSPLDEINEDSVVEVDIDKPSSLDSIASSESPIHRAIYENTKALAIIHAHPHFAVIESLLGHDKIIPPDSEGQYILHEIPVVRGSFGTKELADNTKGALKDHKGVIVFAHGTFAAGKTLEEAYVVTTLIEHSCKLKYYCDMAKR
ncbi:MAG: aldolase [Euryarchaeota archaeon]|nr:aldolase [Euryarchaeota archaeon]